MSQCGRVSFRAQLESTNYSNVSYVRLQLEKDVTGNDGALTTVYFGKDVPHSESQTESN